MPYKYTILINGDFVDTIDMRSRHQFIKFISSKDDIKKIGNFVMHSKLKKYEEYTQDHHKLNSVFMYVPFTKLQNNVKTVTIIFDDIAGTEWPEISHLEFFRWNASLH
jgi:hypothetical protein